MEDFRNAVINLLQKGEYIAGEIDASEVFIETKIKEVGAIPVMDCLMGIVRMYYDNPNVLVGILHAISHLDYYMVGMRGSFIAKACLGHSNKEVIEFALKAFENWESKDNIAFIENSNFQHNSSWLSVYKDKVIADLNGAGNTNEAREIRTSST